MSHTPSTIGQVQRGSIKLLWEAGVLVLQNNGTVSMVSPTDIFQDKKECKRLCRLLRNAAPIAKGNLSVLILDFELGIQPDFNASGAVPSTAGHASTSYHDNAPSAGPPLEQWPVDPQAASTPSTCKNKRGSDGDLYAFAGPSSPKRPRSTSADGPRNQAINGHTSGRSVQKKPSGHCIGRRDKACPKYAKKTVAQPNVFKDHFKEKCMPSYEVKDHAGVRTGFRCRCGEEFETGFTEEERFAGHVWLEHVIEQPASTPSPML